MASQGELQALIDRRAKALPENTAEYDTPAVGSKQFSQAIDHTLLKLDATEEQIDTLCEEAKRFDFKAVCVRLQWVERAVRNLNGSPVRVACVIGFHEGMYPSKDKAEEADKAVRAGAVELDMVINWHLLKRKRFREVYEDIAAVRYAASDKIILKVILETSQLERFDIIAACVIAEEGHADFIKTSTGFCGQGATVENVRLMRTLAGDVMSVKASGGVRNLEDCLTVMKAGAERIGTSNGVTIIEEANGLKGADAAEADDTLPVLPLSNEQPHQAIALMPAPLLTAVDSEKHVHLIIGSNPLASARCTKSIEVGAKPKIVAPPDAEVHYILAKRIEDGQVEWIRKHFEDTDVTSSGRAEVDHVVDAVFVTSGGKTALINVVDAPNLCTFTLLSTHSDGPLQIGITTSGKGCKLASRIRREIASTLPPSFGDAIERLGTMRRRIWEEDHRAHQWDSQAADLEDDDAPAQRPTFNRLVSEDDAGAARTRRMRWLSQICEYWPLKRLAAITHSDIDIILQSYTSTVDTPPLSLDTASLDNRLRPKPQIILAGSGPGSPSLLTLATHPPVLDLIPRRTPVHIARKFPGNAEAAQSELLQLGLEALQKGHTVLRLKQGDPYVYGRGAEEYAFFRERGFAPIVLPGITSALSAPLFAAIPSTHRGAADQILICTGTGRKGAAPDPPPYIPTQTVVFLMALHRLSSLVDVLTGATATMDSSDGQGEAKHWPKETPCAVIERASCPDQRVIRSTLQNICAAVEEEGSRPPGLLVIGWSCQVLKGLNGDGRWVTEEGFDGLDGLEFDRRSGLEFLETDVTIAPLLKQDKPIRDVTEKLGKGAIDGASGLYSQS
ncbi:MAG: hypothetical protein Q9164_002005 [Protoblastenia rupestris]